jgi:acyl carrier protein
MTALTTDEATQIVLRALGRVAPELDPATLDQHEDLAAGYDLDSMDFLNLVENVCAAVHRDIPERDYAQLATVASFAAYLVGSDGTD